MFRNIGSKIMTLAEVVCWIGILLSVFSGIALIAIRSENTLLGILIIVIGSLFSWIGAFFTYGFGHLIQNTDYICKKLKYLSSLRSPEEGYEEENQGELFGIEEDDGPDEEYEEE